MHYAQRGSSLAQASSIFGAMNPHDSNFSIPPITEVSDYVWSRRYSTPKDIVRRISHPDAESALQAAKKACRSGGIILQSRQRKGAIWGENPCRGCIWKHLCGQFPAIAAKKRGDMRGILAAVASGSSSVADFLQSRRFGLGMTGKALCITLPNNPRLFLRRGFRAIDCGIISYEPVVPRHICERVPRAFVAGDTPGLIAFPDKMRIFG